MRLIHTADWQIGRAFRFADDQVMHLLQAARLDVIRTIGRLAVERRASAVLVAGDVFDKQGLADSTLIKTLEAMRAFELVIWHLIPGNHDHHRPNGLWQRLATIGLPGNVRCQLEPVPVALGEEAFLLPALLAIRHAAEDPTGWMDQAATPAGALRIGLAHGSIREFGASSQTPNLIAPDRAARAGLDYLALGDWHGTKQIGERCWYAGTPEPDRFDQPASGQALLVEIDGPGAPPAVTALATGRYRWRQEQVLLQGPDDVALLVERVRREHPDLARLLLDLRVEGTLSLAERQRFEQDVAGSLGGALCHLRLDCDGLLLRPSRDDLDDMGGDGVIRMAAERLKVLAADPVCPEYEAAGRALLRLYLETRKLGANP